MYISSCSWRSFRHSSSILTGLNMAIVRTSKAGTALVPFIVGLWNFVYTWCGCEVPGMILLHNLKGAMRLDRSKDMSVHVFNLRPLWFHRINSSCLEVVALIRLHLDAKMSDKFLEQWINDDRGSIRCRGRELIPFATASIMAPGFIRRRIQWVPGGG